jgi:hypothetical protein
MSLISLEALRAALAEADPGTGTYFGDFTKDPIFILDEDAFVHVPQSVTWDPVDHCFYIKTKFDKEGITDDGSSSSDVPGAGATQP